MSLEEKVGHLLCPEDPGYSEEEWAEIFRNVPLGSVFVGYGNVAGTRAAIEAMQANSRIPILIASDLEHRAGAMITDCTRFPFPMALGATGDVEMARRMGRATAREGRAYGVHWTFSPVVDLNLNFQNPVTNIRSLGDDPHLLYELPHLPNLYLAYSHTSPSRAAAVRAWLGEIEPCGKCSVKQPVS